jgi:hypothetical protein
MIVLNLRGVPRRLGGSLGKYAHRFAALSSSLHESGASLQGRATHIE